MRDADRIEPGDRWLQIPADLLVPAATSYCIHAGNHAEVQATVIAEAANMPITPEAEQALDLRQVTVSPDFVANSATNAWWWWVLFGDIDGSAEQSFEKISTRIGALSDEMFARATEDRTSTRTAAFAIAIERLADINTRFDAFALTR